MNKKHESWLFFYLHIVTSTFSRYSFELIIFDNGFFCIYNIKMTIAP